YGQRLTDRHVAIDQCGHQAGGVHRPVRFRALLAAIFGEMHGNRFVFDALQIEGDTYAVGGGTAEIAVQLHQVSFSLRESSRGRGNETFSGAPSSVRTEIASSCLSRSSI